MVFLLANRRTNCYIVQWGAGINVGALLPVVVVVRTVSSVILVVTKHDGQTFIILIVSIFFKYAIDTLVFMHA